MPPQKKTLYSTLDKGLAGRPGRHRIKNLTGPHRDLEARVEVPTQATSNPEGPYNGGTYMGDRCQSVLSMINPNFSAECPFCDHREMVVHCFSEFGRLSVLFFLLSQMFCLFGETFSQILGFRYRRKQKAKYQLLNFLRGQAKLAIYVTRRNMMGGSLD